MKSYPIELEVSGPLAMWARPDTGATPTSYPVPTWSAAKGLLESIAFLSSGDAWIHPLRVEICRHRNAEGGRVVFQRYATNYGGPLRKGTLIANNNGMQIFATILANTCYRIYADIRTKGEKSGYNPRHYLQDMFQRRLAQGRCFRTPALGWREFTCDYWGAFRNDWLVDEGIDLDIPSMLSAMWDSPHTGEYVSRFVQDVRISKGSLIYAE